MPLKVSDELRKSLPEPDAQGIVRANVAIRVDGDVAHILEINDVPVDDSDSEAGEKNDDANPMPMGDLPDLNAVPGIQ